MTALATGLSYSWLGYKGRTANARLTTAIAEPISTTRLMYPNALISLGLISSDVRMDSALAMSVNRSLVVILKTRMGIISRRESMEGVRETKTAVNASDCNY